HWNAGRAPIMGFKRRSLQCSVAAVATGASWQKDRALRLWSSRATFPAGTDPGRAFEVYNPSSKHSKTFSSDYARHPANSRPCTIPQSTSPRLQSEKCRASSMTRGAKQIHEYEGRMDEYGAINAYVKGSGIQRWGGKDLQVAAEVDRAAIDHEHRHIVTLHAIRCLPLHVGDDAAQYRAVQSMFAARWIPPSPLVGGEHLGGHPAPAPTTPNAIGFGFGTLLEADADESLSSIRRIGAGGPERVVSACTEIDQWLRDEKKSYIFMSCSLGTETLHSWVRGTLGVRYQSLMCVFAAYGEEDDVMSIIQATALISTRASAHSSSCRPASEPTSSARRPATGLLRRCDAAKGKSDSGNPFSSPDEKDAPLRGSALVGAVRRACFPATGFLTGDSLLGQGQGTAAWPTLDE
ncbi:hypothetical protein V498_06509, partial [Pseudogymnoascus sp. VKM F-4517 (FW-2822)]